MKANITMFYFKDGILTDSESKQGNFMVNDIATVLNILNKPATIVCINSYYSETQEEKKELLENVLKQFTQHEATEDYVICTTAYISTSEFPESEWEIKEKNAQVSGKKLVPVSEIIQRDSKLLESLGFININDVVDYQYKAAYIYGNNIGKEVRKYFDNWTTSTLVKSPIYFVEKER